MTSGRCSQRKRGALPDGGAPVVYAKGFTLVELVMILVILGILAVVAIPRFTGGTPYEARGYFDELVSAARYAQLQASTTACPARIALTATDYAVDYDDACGGGSWEAVIHPSRGSDFAGSTPSGVNVSPASLNVVFNGLGVPDNPGQVTVTGGGFNQSFCIRAETGYVEGC